MLRVECERAEASRESKCFFSVISLSKRERFRERDTTVREKSLLKLGAENLKGFMLVSRKLVVVYEHTYKSRTHMDK